jgi:pimeloyl-ACP methyl ester carboxylesterase
VLALLSGGLESEIETPPESDQVNFAPRVHAPLLMVNGRYDFILPVEDSQRLFRLFGTADKDKRYVLADTGHFPPKELMVKEVVGWLDRYLGAPQ